MANHDWLYEDGDGGGAASQDGGWTWMRSGQGLDRRYGWAAAGDPGDPAVWYLSASPRDALLRQVSSTLPAPRRVPVAGKLDGMYRERQRLLYLPAPPP
ncbi:MAG TPA: hypothetical protein VGW38_19785 [Chloroflexota bacterium]|nr:hypothetical protein [Chloroflexota bacterium]